MTTPWIDYNLPSGLIAQEPLSNRADARLMLVDRQTDSISHLHVRDLPRLLQPGDRLVLNDTKVIPAQLRGVRIRTGGKWQGLYLGMANDDTWKLVCKTRGHLRPPEPIMLTDRQGREVVKLWVIEKLTDGQWRARPEGDSETLDLLDRIGHVPLPPYIRSGHMVDADVVNYQTVFAKSPGAVAAPTAGLHFTHHLLQELKHVGIQFSTITLHVGMGTFRPISCDNPSNHPMHAEWAEVTSATTAQLEATSGRIIAVGTTVARTLETVASKEDWPGRKGSATAEISAMNCLRQGWSGETDLFIRPPFEFRAIDMLLTNFHFPKTTLLLLVQAFGGSDLIREAYSQAVREEYRFYSYGDAMLIQ
jgi:S-adenosylmethionine:tRNA ribosyltransferase-isomerase